MSLAAYEVLKSIYGYESFRGHQEKIIQHVMTGGDAFVLMPTGSGKSLCYQIPAICRQGVGIVVSPLVALMQDQIEDLTQRGVRAAAINSSIDFRTNADTLNQMQAGELDLLYVAPERILTEEFLDALKQTRLALFAIDEAHCVSQWGHDFRPHYAQLTALADLFPDIPRLALTATADAPTRKDIVERLRLTKGKTFISGFDRPNIHYSILPKDNPKQQILSFIKEKYPEENGIIYCGTRALTEEATEWFQGKGFKVLSYHAGMSKEERVRNQRAFQNEENVIMAATVAFGMGIDKPNVRFVAHLSLPKNIEAYYQETGRAGRDGLPAHALLCYGLNDVVMQRRFIDTAQTEENQKRIEHQKLNALLGLCEASCCRRQVVLEYFGDRCSPCGNCDNCDNPPETFDATVEAQKAMSCVYRTNQRFGVAYLIDVLQGKEDGRIQKFHHDKISTFGIGRDLTKVEWQNIFRQLVSQNLLSVDIEAHGGLRLSPKGQDVLRTREKIYLRKYIHLPKRSKKSQQPPIQFIKQEDKDLFEELKQKRREIATDLAIPPYIIFHDSTLREMASARPQTIDDLSKLKGLGERKLKTYGAEFLNVILTHLEKQTERIAS